MKREVGARLKLVDGSDGRRLWEHERKVSNWDFALKKKEAKKKFIKGVVVRQVEKALHVPLLPETRRLAKKIVRRLPKRPF